MTPQELFDSVAEHLLTQRKQSIGSNKWCLYRGPDGLKCALGHLIPDKLYSTDMETCSIHAEIVQKALGSLPWFSQNFELIGQLQMIHDGEKPHEWAEKLWALAKKEELSVEVVLKHRPSWRYGLDPLQFIRKIRY